MAFIEPVKVNLKKCLDRTAKKPKSESSAVSFLSLYQYATTWELCVLVFGLLCCALSGASQTISTWNFCQIIKFLIERSRISEITAADDEALWNATIQYAINDGIALFSYFAFKTIALMSLNYVAFSVVLRMRGLLLRAMMNWDMSWYDLNSNGELSNRITNDLSDVEDAIGERVVMYIQYFMEFIFMVLLSIICGRKISVACICTLPIILGVIYYFSVRVSMYAKAACEASAKANAVAEEVFSAIRTVHAFDGKEKENERYNEIILGAEKVTNRLTTNLASMKLIQWLLNYSGFLIAAQYGARIISETPDTDYTEAFLITFLGLAVSASRMTFATKFMVYFSTAQGAATKPLQLIQQATKINPAACTGLQPYSCLGNIHFKKVCFHYPSRPDTHALKDFELNICSGEVIAIVGHSGSGKSTCVQLIQRLYDPTCGEILLDGINIKSLNVNWLRERTAVVCQDPVLFEATIYDNIRYGRESATKQDIEEAAKIANAHDFIIKLPQGYNTQVGERGSQLSGGQRQRIAIARAVVRNPVILLLDEATSALDLRNESKVQEALERASKGRTTIVVAHRLTAVRNADKIVVMDRGQIVEMGSHVELMAKRNFYYEMFTCQLNQDTENNQYLKSSVNISGSQNHDNNDISHVNQPVNEHKTINKSLPQKSSSMWDIWRLQSEDRHKLLLGTVSAFLIGVSIPTTAEYLGGFIGVIAENNKTSIIYDINFYSILMLIQVVITAWLLFFETWWFGQAGASLTKYARKVYFGAMLEQEIGWFDQKANGVGALCARLSGETAALDSGLGLRMSTMTVCFGILLGALVVSFRHEWRLATIGMTAFPIFMFFAAVDEKFRHKLSSAKAEALTSSSKLVVEVVSNIRTVVSLGRQEMFFEKYMEILRPVFQRQKANMIVRAVCYSLCTSATGLVTLPIVCFSSYLILNGENLGPDLVTKICRIFASISTQICIYLSYSPNVDQALLAASNIFSLLERKPKITDHNNEPNQTEISESNGNVSYEHVTFGYPTSADSKVLQNLNLDVTSGQNIALVGPSGCGKSTCLQLLQRFYDVENGRISVDSQNIRRMPLRSLRRKLGIVSQEASLFNRTIAENIAYGDNARKPDMNEIIEAAKKANIHIFVQSLSKGYETRVGDKGTQLSGGQKQRIAIARALIRDPKILLLDEATSALDVESEKVVQAALDRAKKGRTCITIAHRLVTIMNADIIYVMKDGGIVESGSHEKLLEMRGIYYGLYKSQCVGGS